MSAELPCSEPLCPELLCMGEPMLEFNQLPPQPDGARHYLEGHGGTPPTRRWRRRGRAPKWG